MNIDGLNIKTLRRDSIQTPFLKAYEKLLLGQSQNLKEQELLLLLKIAVIFLNSKEKDLVKFGYRIVLRYANLYQEYESLYQVALQKGFVPVSKFIENDFINKNQYLDSGFLTNFYGAYKELFKDGSKYLSYGQKHLIEFAKNNDNDFAVVAPTSYGKSEMIISRVLRAANKKLCVLVPTKALLAQTKKRLFENAELAKSIKRIITHPEMYKGTEESFVAVLTQERLLRLMQKNPKFTLDTIFIDEAHNLLRDDSRSILLAQVLLIAKKRNKNVRFNFFTPFVADKKSLIIPYAKYNLTFEKTEEFIKIEKFYLINMVAKQPLKLYDQFLDEFITIEKTSQDEIKFIEAHKAKKNIVYLNRPKDIEHFALSFNHRKKGKLNSEVQEIYNAISEFLHPDYNLLKCIKNGVVYHHGGMPDIIRLYVEMLFSSDEYFDLIVTNSTLLEGVNIPAERIFLLTVKIGRRAFNKPQFKNLIGRVCRFSEVFNTQKGGLGMLEPEIYMLKGQYEDGRINLENFIKRVGKSDAVISDEVGNVLLHENEKNLDADQKQALKNSLEYLENIEPKTVDAKDVDYIKSEIGKLCYKNNVYDFNIKVNETQLINNLKAVEVNEVSEVGALIELIYLIFIKDIEITDENFNRLDNESARKFYSMVLNWRVSGSSYKQLIGKLTSYWKKLDTPIIYAGSKWGEITRDFGHKLLYVDISEKSEAEKINLAIHRIKEEQDFVDNTLIKYVEILKDLGFVQSEFYDKVKYGSTDPKIICLLKNGFSIELAKCVIKATYTRFVEINLKNDEVFVSSEIVAKMEDENENRILIFEIGFHVTHP